jgi:hypothetical protein
MKFIKRGIMKKFISLFLLLAALVFSNGFEANAQTVKRIEFAKGKSSATVRDNTGSTGVYYDLRVKGGQKMVLNLSPASKVGIKVEASGGGEVLLREERGGYYELYFEEGKNVSIFVGSLNGKPVPFTLTVKITRMTDI